VGLIGAGVEPSGAGVAGAAVTGVAVGGGCVGEALGCGRVGLCVGRTGHGSSSILPYALKGLHGILSSAIHGRWCKK
jgi:hypothetical protein